MSKIFLSLISFYQIFLSFDKGLFKFLAPGGACKYPVSCSEYTKQMINQFGAWKGVYLGFMRFLTCR